MPEKKSTQVLHKHRSMFAGTCLVSELATELLSHQGPLSDVVVVLPTQRLQRYLVRELVLRQGGACLLPCIQTWDVFLDGVLSLHQSATPVMVSTQAELVMETVIAQLAKAPERNRPFNVNSSHAHELLHFYSELYRAGHTVAARHDIKTRLNDQWHRSSDAMTVLSHRIDDVFDVLCQFESHIFKHGWTTKAAQRADAITNFLLAAKDGGERWLDDVLGSKRILICGLTSLPKIETDLLSGLSRSQRCAVWLDLPPPHLQTAPLIRLRSAVGLSGDHAPSESWAKNIKTIRSALNMTQEATQSLNWALELMQSGIHAHDIAIIVTDEKAYETVYSSTKEIFESRSSEALGFPLTINLPLANAWSCSSAATWLRLCRNLARDFNLGDFGQYALNPITQKLFNAANLDFYNFQQKLKDLTEYPGAEGERFARYLSQQLDAEMCKYLNAALSWCMNYPPYSSQSIAQMAEKLLALASSERLDDLRRKPKQRDAWRIVTEAVEQVQDVSNSLGYSDGDWARFLNDVYQSCEAEVLRDTGEPLSGLQIIGLTEARYIPFSHAMIVGCIEGAFPQALPADSLIDNTLRESVGIPGWSELEALEDTTFHLLTSRVPNVDLSYPRSDNEAPQVRSRWIEMLRSDIPIHDAGPSDGEIWLGCSESVPRFAAKTDSDAEGLSDDYEDLLKLTSASKLRSLLWCPYRYLLEMRHVQAVELPEDRKQLIVGQILHKVLETFFRDDDIAGISPNLSLKHCPKSGSSFVNWAVLRLEAIAKSLIPPDLKRSEDFQQMLGKGWLDVATFWGELLDSGFTIHAVETELSIGKVKPAEVNLSGLDVKLRGSIDAVHRSGNFAVLVDYKTSSIPQKRLIASGLEPQLPLYAEVFSQSKVDRDEPFCTEKKNIAAVYFNLRDGKPTVAAVGASVKPLLQSNGMIGRNARPEDMDETVQAVRDRWSARLDTIRSSHRFEADPSDCDYCPFDGICRKDDPRFRDVIATQFKAGHI